MSLFVSLRQRSLPSGDPTSGSSVRRTGEPAPGPRDLTHPHPNPLPEGEGVHAHWELLDAEQDLALFDGLTWLGGDRGYLAAAGQRQLIFHLHRLQQR